MNILISRGGLVIIGLVACIVVSIPLGGLAASFSERVRGRIVLAVESRGEAWYVSPTDNQRYYLRDGLAAYDLMRRFGLGITNHNLANIPVGLDHRIMTPDSDGDGLNDRLEEGLYTNFHDPDTDHDGYTDYDEVVTGYNQVGPGKMWFDQVLINRLRGRIVLQVEERGQAWYIHPVDGKRYYLGTGADAYQLMRFLSLGITTADLNRIPVGSADSPPVAPAAAPVAPPATPSEVSSSSLNLGLVHFHYYGNLGGYTGAPFLDDQKWAADTINLALIGWGDDGSDRAWAEIKKNNPSGNWLKWRLAQVFNTAESDGSCTEPSKGVADQSLAYQQAELSEFLATYPQYGDGESCFLHAATSGTINVRWHANACSPSLAVTAGQRLETLIWNEYGWLINVESDCAKDFMAWRTIKDIQREGYGGVGFDNIGGPGASSDGYYLPLALNGVQITEIPSAILADQSQFDTWWHDSIEALLEYVTTKTRAAVPTAKIVYNGGAYCSWDGSVDWFTDVATPGLGVWCEDALHYPHWGSFGTADRLRTMIKLSAALTSQGSFVVHESFYDAGRSNPTADEVMWYLGAYYIYRNGDDVLAIKPDWDPYQPLRESVWFEVFSRDIGQPTAAAVEGSAGVFTRRYAAANGQTALVVVRADGQTSGTVSFTLDRPYCRVTANNQLQPVASSISLSSGDTFLLIADGTGGVTCR